MYIETNQSAQQCTIWIDKEHSINYKNDATYQNALKNSKAAGYAVCVFVGGDLPLVPVVSDLLNAPSTIVA